MEKLIFDLGCYTLDSSEKYLYDDYKVIAIDANIDNINKCEKKYFDFVKNEKLILVNKAISYKDDLLVDFYIAPDCLVWSSLNKGIAERIKKSNKVVISTITLKSLIEKYGTPYYCKIDVEGADILALESLVGCDKDMLPKIISCETECLGVGETTDGLEVINKLYEIGYSKFFIVKQPKSIDIPFNDEPTWYNYEEICKILTETRDKHHFITFYDFWYDVYSAL